MCSCYIKRGVLQLIRLWEIMGGMLLMCQNTTMRVCGPRIKRYCVLCLKHIAVRVVITSRWFATSRLVAPVSGRLVYIYSLRNNTDPYCYCVPPTNTKRHKFRNFDDASISVQPSFRAEYFRLWKDLGVPHGGVEIGKDHCSFRECVTTER